MRKRGINLFVMVMIATTTFAGGLKVGDKAPDFRLKNVDGSLVSLADYKEAKGFILIFTCNHCPYAKAYEDRIIGLHHTYAPEGYPVVAVNPNDPAVVPQDSWENMKIRAKEKLFPFAYLFDQNQEVFPQYGATRTPQVYLLQKQEGGLVVQYIGTIDDNYADPTQVKERFLASAVEAVIKGETPDPSHTKAIGCSIKVKK